VLQIESIHKDRGRRHPRRWPSSCHRQFFLGLSHFKKQYFHHVVLIEYSLDDMDDISKMFLEMVDSIVKILLRPNCSLQVLRQEAGPSLSMSFLLSRLVTLTLWERQGEHRRFALVAEKKQRRGAAAA